MARPIYAHELSDPDFQWLLNAYQESRGPLMLVESGCQPILFIQPHHDPYGPFQKTAPQQTPDQAPVPAEADADPSGGESS